MTFHTAILNHVRCSKDCGRTTRQRNAARATARANYVPRFVGVDGEGVTLADGSHPYVLLSVGERSLHRDGADLSCDEIFSFLWECFLDDPDAVYVGYYLGYDFTHWLRTLPQDRAAMVFTPERRKRTRSGSNPSPFPVYYNEWEFDVLGMKRFKLRREGAKQWLYINDVGGFYQQPFALAMHGWQDKDGKAIALMDDDERAIIEEGKAARATAKFDKAMIRYNVTENRVLARMMGVLAEGFLQMGVRLSRDQWFGPGQVAQKWMDQHSTHSAKRIGEAMTTQPLLLRAADAAKHAFFGGWFETMAHGHIPGSTWEYDIASAYPHIHSRLPCLLHGRWDYAEHELEGDYVLVRADVRGDNPHIGAMLHRDRKGNINRPDFTSGWYWRHEIEAAKRAKLICETRVFEAYRYTPCACPPPLRDLREQYKHRLEVGKNTPHGRSLKLNYNSCYGKTAQSIGTPKYANAIHASLITAGCRTMILDAIASHPKGAASVVMVATDGIYFDAPHPGLQNQPAELGAWEETRKDNLTIFLPGVYWDDASRASRASKAVKLKSRGISARDLMEQLDALDAGFTRMLKEPIPWTIGEGIVSPEWWLKLELPVRFSMVSPKQALQRGKWETCGVVTNSGTRTLWAHPRHKRGLVFGPDQDRPYIHTQRPLNLDCVASTPYNKSFGMELEKTQDENFILTPDGNAMDEAYEIIRG